MKMGWLGLALILGVPEAGAKTTATYRIGFGVPDAGNQVARSSRGSVEIGGGWYCWAEGAVGYQEKLRDYKGEVVSKDRREEHPGGHSLLANPSLEMVIEKNIGDQEPGFFFAAAERCRECHTEAYYLPDSKGNLRIHYRAECSYARLVWRCEVPQPPGLERPLKVACTVADEGYQGRTPKEKLRYLRKAPASLTVTREKVEEKHETDLCDGRREGRVTLALRQGVGGHKGENDFRFKVTVGDRPPFEIQSRDGILNHDIAYCPGGGEVAVKIEPYEKDLLFNDKYQPVGEDTFRFDVARGTQTSTLEYKRRSYFGTTPRRHTIAVTMKAPGQAPPMLATTH